MSIACVGDSLTEGTDHERPEASYPGRLQAMLDQESPGQYIVVNLGSSGATARRRGDIPYWASSQFRALQSVRWDLIIVMLGTNDAVDQHYANCEPLAWLIDLVTAMRLKRPGALQ